MLCIYHPFTKVADSIERQSFPNTQKTTPFSFLKGLIKKVTSSFSRKKDVFGTQNAGNSGLIPHRQNNRRISFLQKIRNVVTKLANPLNRQDALGGAQLGLGAMVLAGIYI